MLYLTCELVGFAEMIIRCRSSELIIIIPLLVRRAVDELGLLSPNTSVTDNQRANSLLKDLNYNLKLQHLSTSYNK